MPKDEDREQQRRSWAIEQLMSAHPGVSREQAEAVYERVAARLHEPPPVAAPPVGRSRARLRTRAGRRRPAPGPDAGLILASLGIAIAGLGLAYVVARTR